MADLIKIRDVSLNYGVSTRTLRYYENAGLITGIRNDDYAYRMYDEANLKRLEQILILRKLNISIKDIQMIFNTEGSQIVLDVLGKKVDDIDDEVSLLQELKEIVLDFIRQVEDADFNNGSDVKMLYEKARVIEGVISGSDYEGKPSDLNRLVEITDRLNKKIPDVMIVKIPKFKAVTSGSGEWDEWFKLMDWAWSEERVDFFKNIIFDCVDFLIRKDGKFEYIMAVNDSITESDTAPFNIIDFEGGLYAMAVCVDGDDESLNKVEGKIFKWIENTNFEYDSNRGVMGHMAYCDDEVKKGLGYEQLQRYVPIKLKSE